MRYYYQIFLWILFSLVSEGLPSSCIRIIFFSLLIHVASSWWDGMIWSTHASCINRFFILFLGWGGTKKSKQKLRGGGPVGFSCFQFFFWCVEVLCFVIVVFLKRGEVGLLVFQFPSVPSFLQRLSRTILGATCNAWQRGIIYLVFFCYLVTDWLLYPLILSSFFGWDSVGCIRRWFFFLPYS